MKNILITGVSRGLGLVVARQVVGKGWTVYGVSRSHSKDLMDLQSEFPDRVHHCAHDLSDSEGLKQKIFHEFIGADVPLHGLVNNAASTYDDLITNLKLDELETLFSVNVFSPMMATRESIRNMILHGTAGSIIHVSSISAHTGYKGLAMYAATKGALEAFSKNTAREWGTRSIRSNCVVPGFMETEMTDALDPSQRDKIFSRTALKQPTAVASVASAVVYLLGDEASSVTGQNMFVDAGTI